MAEVERDLNYDHEDLDINKVIRIQAFIRGTLVRRWMDQVKQDYRKVVTDVELNTLIGVSWKTDLICLPKKFYRSQQLPTDKGTTLATKKSSKRSSRSQHLTSDTPARATVFCKSADAEIQTGSSLLLADKDEEPEQVNGFQSVEIQTSLLLNPNISPPSDYVRDADEEVGNFLEDIDTSWKDRVVPFVQDNNSDLSSDKDSARRVNNEMHLELHSAEEEETPRSWKESQIDNAPRATFQDRCRPPSRGGNLPVDSDKDDVTPYSNRSSIMSEILVAQNSAGFDPVSQRSDCVDLEGQRSGRSGHSGRTRSARSDFSGRPDLSVRSDINVGKGQRSNRSDLEDRIPQRSKGEGHRSDRSEAERRPRSGGYERSTTPRSGRSQKSDRYGDNEDRQHMVGKISRSGDTGKGQMSSKSEGSHSDRSEKSNQSAGSCGRSPDRRSERSERSNQSAGSRGRSPDRGGRSERSNQSAGSRGRSPDRGGRSERSNQSAGSHGRSPDRGGRSERSNQSAGSRGRSPDRSGRSERSNQSAGSHGRSPDRSGRSERSNQSAGSRGRSPDRGGRSERSNQSAGSRGRSPDRRRSHDRKMPHSLRSVSPAERHTDSQRVPDSGIHGNGRSKLLPQDSTSLTNVTSVWGSYISTNESQDLGTKQTLPDNVENLREMRKSVAMELLWVRQAIESRKNYLRLKGQM